ncbi:MAG TPA: GAF domain-containing protein [Blastocatellia bacterium]|jgi:putative methionine-R-sulfoxide reductase with GAF domain|nr:GAF domain-containing protein [Blastocatellia bacterium]
MQEELEAIVEEFGAETGSIHLIEEGMLRLKAHVGLAPRVVQIVEAVPIGKGMAGLAAERNEPVSTCNIQADESGDIPSGAKLTGVNGAIVVPIRGDRGEVRGTLGIGVFKPYDYTPEEVARLLDLGRTLAAALVEGRAD